MGSGNVTNFYGCRLASSDSVKQHKLRKLVAWLSDKEGKGKEFVSLYVPSEFSLSEVVTILKKESDTAVTNSERITERLQDALKLVIGALKQKKEIPENGFAIFAGTFLADNSQNEALRVEELNPPKPVTSYLFQVDDHFHLEPIRAMMRQPRTVGLIALDAKEASFGVLNGERLESVETITSGIPGKSGKGGQSQRRYERERDMEVTNFFHRISDHATKKFLEDHKVTALIVGGPGTTKLDFLSGDFLHYELKNAHLSTVDTQSASTQAIKEILNKSVETRQNMCSSEEKRIMQRLLTELGKQNGLAIAGLYLVIEALKKGQAEVALANDNTEMIELVAMCKKCRHISRQIISQKEKMDAQRSMKTRPCEKCKATDYEVEEKDIIDVLEDLATQTDARVEVILTPSEEKNKLKTLSGFAAILRYNPK